jgi:hypothetical protein
LIWSPELYLVPSTEQRTSGSGIKSDSGKFLSRTLLHGVTAVRDKTNSILASWPERMIFHSALRFLLLFIYILFSELTNYSINCCHLVPPTPLRESCCIAASLRNLSSQAIKLMYWFCRHDWSSTSDTCFIFLQTKWMNIVSPCLGHQPRGDVWRKGDIELRSTDNRRISYLTSETTMQALEALSETPTKKNSYLKTVFWHVTSCSLVEVYFR